MIKIKRLQKYILNGLILSLAAILMRTVGVGFNVYVSGKVGAEGMGLLNLTSSVYGFAITLATSGINLAVVRLVSSAIPYGNEEYFDKESDIRVRKIMKSALLYCLFFSVLASVFLFTGAKWIGTHALGDKRTVPSLKLLSFTLVPISLSSALHGYFNAVRRVYKSVIVQICEQGAKITVVSALLVLIAPKGLEYACIAVVAGGAVSEAICVTVGAALYFFDRRIHRQKKFKLVKKVDDFEKKCHRVSVFDVNGVKKGCFIASAKQSEKTKKQSVASIAFPVAVSAYVRSALLTVEHLAIPWGLRKSGESRECALASYGILHGMVFPLLLFPSAVLGSFSSLLIPELSSALEKKDSQRIEHIVTRVFHFALLFAIGVCGIFLCFSQELGIIIYKSSEASLYIKLLSPLIPLMYLDTAVDSMLKGLGEQLYTMRVNIADSFISVLLVVTLLPGMGITGYVIVIFIMELFNTSLSIIRLLNVTGVKPRIFLWVCKPLILIVGATSLTRLIFLWDFLYNPISALFNDRAVCFIEIGVCALIYLAFCCLTKEKFKSNSCQIR